MVGYHLRIADKLSIQGACIPYMADEKSAESLGKISVDDKKKIKSK
jgi:hypothetical protein